MKKAKEPLGTYRLREELLAVLAEICGGEVLHERVELLEPCHQFIILLQRLGKAKARVNDHIAHPHATQGVEFATQVMQHIIDYIVIIG